MVGDKPGPPKEYERKIFARITDEQHAHLLKTYGSISEAIRLLIDADIRQRGDAAQAPGEKDGEQEEGGE